MSIWSLKMIETCPSIEKEKLGEQIAIFNTEHPVDATDFSP